MLSINIINIGYQQFLGMSTCSIYINGNFCFMLIEGRTYLNITSLASTSIIEYLHLLANKKYIDTFDYNTIH